MTSNTTRTYSTGRTWGVGTKKYAISDSSAETALKYGKTVSKGIAEMERQIVTLRCKATEAHQ